MEHWPECFVVSYRIDGPRNHSAYVVHIPVDSLVHDYAETALPSRVSRPFETRAGAQALADDINQRSARRET